MTIDIWMHKAALIASYFSEFLALPSHAERLALLRLARHRAEFAASEAITQETTRLCLVLDEFAQLERRLPGTSRPLVQGALRAWAERCAAAGQNRPGAHNQSARTHNPQAKQ
jgi:hypothetical protein